MLTGNGKKLTPLSPEQCMFNNKNIIIKKSANRMA
jgi:hypothetical protein